MATRQLYGDQREDRGVKSTPAVTLDMSLETLFDPHGRSVGWPRRCVQYDAGAE
jgi:hypothetical protein